MSDATNHGRLVIRGRGCGLYFVGLDFVPNLENQIYICLCYSPFGVLLYIHLPTIYNNFTNRCCTKILQVFI